MTDNLNQAQAGAIADIRDPSINTLSPWTAGHALVAVWKRSLLFKIIIVFLSGIMLAYSAGALVGWSMFVDAAKQQWNNQARINTQIASATLRNIYTYVVVDVDASGQVERIVTSQPVGDDDSVLYTGFNPTDVLALVTAQTKNDTWLFRYDADTDTFIDAATSSRNASAVGHLIARDEPLFAEQVTRGRLATGFATIGGQKHYLGLLPIVNPDCEQAWNSDPVFGVIGVEN